MFSVGASLSRPEQSSPPLNSLNTSPLLLLINAANEARKLIPSGQQLDSMRWPNNQSNVSAGSIVPQSSGGWPAAGENFPHGIVRSDIFFFNISSQQMMRVEQKSQSMQQPTTSTPDADSDTGNGCHSKRWPPQIELQHQAEVQVPSTIQPEAVQEPVSRERLEIKRCYAEATNIVCVLYGESCRQAIAAKSTKIFLDLHDSIKHLWLPNSRERKSVNAIQTMLFKVLRDNPEKLAALRNELPTRQIELQHQAEVQVPSTPQARPVRQLDKKDGEFHEKRICRNLRASSALPQHINQVVVIRHNIAADIAGLQLQVPPQVEIVIHHLHHLQRHCRRYL